MSWIVWLQNLSWSPNSPYLRMGPYLYIRSLQMQLVKMRSYWSGWACNLIWLLYKRRKIPFEHTYTRACAHTHTQKTTEAQRAMTQLKPRITKDWWQPLKARKSQRRILSRISEEAWPWWHDTLISESQPPKLERIKLCCFKPFSLWYCVMAALEN